MGGVFAVSIWRNRVEIRDTREDWVMANPVKRYAEPPPSEPRNHADFERFIQELDAGQLPPCRPRDRNATDAEIR